MENGEHEGTLRFRDWGDVAYSAKARVLPGRHILVAGNNGESPVQADDYALCLLDPSGLVASWYDGSQRLYGDEPGEVIGRQHGAISSEALARAAHEGHASSEGWQEKRDGSRFWANVIELALRDENGVLRGYARVVRDFSHRHEVDESLRRAQARARAAPKLEGSTVSAVVSGEFEQVLEANDAFLDLIGYDHDDLKAGRLTWTALTPPDFAAIDELAHEEELRFGACTPYEKELLRSDGRRAPVLVTTAVLKLNPFRWIAFVQSSGERQWEERAGQVTEATHQFEEIVGTSATMNRLMAQVEVVAPTSATVLILGETGTGKELMARAVHKASHRKDLPFITLNCAAIPTGLLESELFGYERGAFTGALSQKIGRFEMANRGTLFLDEVGDIPLDIQPKLLRALQEKLLERLGGTRTIPVDVRLIAATNRNLTQMMGDKLFRADLYYRLKVFPITTPPLRDHPRTFRFW